MQAGVMASSNDKKKTFTKNALKITIPINQCIWVWLCLENMLQGNKHFIADMTYHYVHIPSCTHVMINLKTYLASKEISSNVYSCMSHKPHVPRILSLPGCELMHDTK